MKDVLVKVDKNGTKYWANNTCQRCGGHGYISCYTHVEGGVCFDCGGSGIAHKPTIWKEYTPEYEAKLAEQRAKREQKRIAKLEAEWGTTAQKWLSENNFNSEGKTFLFLGNTYEIKEDIKALGGSYDHILGWHIDHEVEGYQFLQISVEEVTVKDLFKGYSFEPVADEIKARCLKEFNKLNDVQGSEWIGEVGERIDMELTLSHVASWEQNKYCGYGTEFMYLYTFKDDKGNELVWKTTCFELCHSEGKKFQIRGTIKEHSEYKGTKQTVLTRCKVKEVK